MNPHTLEQGPTVKEKICADEAFVLSIHAILVSNEKDLIRLSILTPITSNEFTDIAKFIMHILNEKLVIYYHSKDKTIKMKQTPLELMHY